MKNAKRISGKKVKTFLPMFRGFYNTIWELDIDSFCYNEKVEFDQLDIDYDGYKKDIVKKICEVLPKYCPFIKYIKFEEIVSPKEYNFYNDSADVIITFKARELKKYLKDNEESLSEYLKNRYSSRDGFISYYPNSYIGWYEETNKFTNLDGHYLGALLNFYFLNEYGDGFIIDKLYYDVKESVCEYEYISINEPDEDSCSKEQILRSAIENNLINFEFGYMQILKREADGNQIIFGEDWIDYLIWKYPNELYKEIPNNAKFNSECELIEN